MMGSNDVANGAIHLDLVFFDKIRNETMNLFDLDPANDFLVPFLWVPHQMCPSDDHLSVNKLVSESYKQKHTVLCVGSIGIQGKS